MEAVVERLGAPTGRLIDLGCGGGHLCDLAALAGFDATGLDVAPGMIEQAERHRQRQPPAHRDRMRFAVGDATATGLPGGADAVTALGLIEYLPDDSGFFAEVARLLRPGGVLVVSCRNRLFNAMSGNAYTLGEVEAGEAPRLLAELANCRPGPELRGLLRAYVARLRELLPALEAALAQDDAEPAGPPPSGPRFAERRRQHTPDELARAAAAAGFREPSMIGIHPHPLPPALEAASPRLYNQLALAMEPLERSVSSLAWSSAFLGVFTR
jgi:SAM-dependent methyltransferase